MKVAALLCAIVFALGIQPALAADPVRIIVGGPTTAKSLEPLKDELKKAAGTDVEVSVNPIDRAIIAVRDGTIDFSVGPLDTTFESGEKRAGTKLNRDDFDWFVITRSAHNIGLHPDNPVSSLTKQQISDVLSGKIKNWKELGGSDLPIVVLQAENLVASVKAANQFFIGQDTTPVAKMVRDANGLVNAVKANKGALAFFTSPQKGTDFSPKFFKNGVVSENAMIGRKKMRPEARKLFDHLKETPLWKREKE